MFKKLKERNLHIVVVAFFLGTFLGFNVTFLEAAKEPAHRYLDYFHQVYQVLRTEYVDAPSTKDLFYGAIRGMIKSLDDPFSRFLDEESLGQLKEMTTGKFVGVGIEITVRDSEVVVISPIADSPAMDAGIQAGDIIEKVNEKPIKGKKLTEIVKMIKGLPQSSVDLSVRREGFDEPLHFKIKRAPIKIKSVQFAVLDGTNIGYIKVKSFGTETTGDVKKAIDDLKKKNVEKIIMDLRYNPGGLLTAAVGLSDLFLDKEQVIVSTKGRNGKNERVFKSQNDPLAKGPLVVLVNKGSASASEIFSGAIRDNKRGTLMGEKTFGKGSVQKTFSLDENVGIAVTIAKYYTPSGELIHKKGIKPDVKVSYRDLTKEEKKALGRINKEKLLDAFVKKGTLYDEKTKKEFQAFLKKKNIAMSDWTANLVLKNKVYQYKKRPLYDLEFDSQLTKAMETLKDKK